MKAKTKKTLAKRVRITRNGKIMRKQSRIGHLKVKWSSSRKYRKAQKLGVENASHKRLFKKLLKKRGKAI